MESTAANLFWKRVAASRLLSEREVERARADARQKNELSGDASPEQAAKFLVSKALLTRFQASLILADKVISFWVGPYVIQDRVDLGVIGRPWVALHRETGYRVLLARLRPQLIASAEQRLKINASIRRASQVRHPHVWRLFEMAEAAESCFVVMEWPEGKSLLDRMQSASPAPSLACQWTSQIAFGVSALRSAGYSPACVTPADVWIDVFGRPKLRHPVLSELLTAPNNTPDSKYQSFWAPESLTPAEGELTSSLQGLGVPATALIYSLGQMLKYLLGRAAPGQFALATDPVGQPIEDLLDLSATVDPEHRLQSLETFAEAARKASGIAAQEAAVPLPSLLAYDRWLDEQNGGLIAEDAGWDDLIEPTTPKTERPLQVKSRTGVVVADSKKKTPSKSVASRWLLAAATVLCFVPAYFGGVAASKWLFNSTRSSSLTPHESTASDAGLKASHADSHQTESVNTSSSSPVATSTANSMSSRVVTVSDDGSIPWLSPTDGKPVEWRYTPPAAAFVLVLRPAEMLTSSEGSQVVTLLKALGFDLEAASQAVGLPGLKVVDQLIWCIHPTESGLVSSQVWRCHEGYLALQAPDQAKWIDHAGERYCVAAQRALWSSSNAPHVLVSAPEMLIKELLDEAGETMPRREYKELLEHSDASRHIVLISTPQFVVSDASRALEGPGMVVRESIVQWCGDKVSAVLLSVHFQQEGTYMEMLVAGDTATRATDLQKYVVEQMGEWAPRVAQWSALRHATEYASLPLMVQTWVRYTRVGVEGKHVLANVYLPAGAVHDTVSGSAHVLTGSGATGDAMANSSSTLPLTTNGIDEPGSHLARPVTIKFPQESFEDALQILSQEIDNEIEIVGAELRKEGITKNQPIRNFDVQGIPAEQALLKMLLQANPAGKLVYVQDSQGKIWVTTRQGAADAGWKLPASLAHPAAKPKPGKGMSTKNQTTSDSAN